MTVLEKIRPIRNHHSIKEAVITIFLQNPIVSPSRFGSLLAAEYKGKFQEFEVFDQVDVSLALGLDKSLRTQTRHQTDTGFRFTAFDEKGRPRIQIQGCNEPDRSFLSYHVLDYSRWDSFFLDYKALIRPVADQQDFFVMAFDLQYQDEFYWLDKENPIDTGLIFDDASPYLSRQFFTTGDARLALSLEDDESAERLEINSISSAVQPLVAIKHTVARLQRQAGRLREVVDSPSFEQSLALAHEANKQLLRQLLRKPILERINLT